MATYRIEVSATAERQIRKLPRADQVRVSGQRAAAELVAEEQAEAGRDVE